MRKLNGGDLFNALRMLRALDLKGVVEAYSKTANAKTDEDKQAANMALFDRLVSNASDPESEEVLFSWLAGPLEKSSAEEVRTMPLDELGQCLEILGKDNDLRGFFGRAMQLTRML
nr:MAG TPA: hypothetical protein [Caudoviricetes sp.]